MTEKKILRRINPNNIKNQKTYDYTESNNAPEKVIRMYLPIFIKERLRIWLIEDMNDVFDICYATFKKLTPELFEEIMSCVIINGDVGVCQGTTIYYLLDSELTKEQIKLKEEELDKFLQNHIMK